MGLAVKNSKDTNSSVKNQTQKTDNQYKFQPIKGENEKKQAQKSGEDDDDEDESGEDFDLDGDDDDDEDYSAFGETSMSKSKKDTQSHMHKTATNLKSVANDLQQQSSKQGQPTNSSYSFDQDAEEKAKSSKDVKSIRSKMKANDQDSIGKHIVTEAGGNNIKI